MRRKLNLRACEAGRTGLFVGLPKIQRCLSLSSLRHSLFLILLTKLVTPDGDLRRFFHAEATRSRVEGRVALDQSVRFDWRRRGRCRSIGPNELHRSTQTIQAERSLESQLARTTKPTLQPHGSLCSGSNWDPLEKPCLPFLTCVGSHVLMCLILFNLQQLS